MLVFQRRVLAMLCARELRRATPQRWATVQAQESQQDLSVVWGMGTENACTLFRIPCEQPARWLGAALEVYACLEPCRTVVERDPRHRVGWLRHGAASDCVVHCDAGVHICPKAAHSSMVCFDH
ncbi:Hypothetical protein, putative [Bodo saltans]|uniref:Uncharacterized protein n=1 Tax=Bodo saltans TaxID=75058 RepID=A0A0S4JRL9_BODSA|nr:Hypothetical protein, putative [Bodo saltans]|eukprot:CUG92849.1 Hypothetical protein, putative [Bodo saltans]